MQCKGRPQQGDQEARAKPLNRYDGLVFSTCARILCCHSEAEDFVVDAYDPDANGKTEKAVGRVFYTQGKSLVFYTYDLSASRSDTGRPQDSNASAPTLKFDLRPSEPRGLCRASGAR